MMKILVPVDGSDHAWRALDIAVDVALTRTAELLCLHVVPPEAAPESLQTLARLENMPVEEELARYHEALQGGDALTQQAELRARDRGIGAVRSLGAEGSPAPKILDVARQEQVDMIVMGTKGRSDWAAAFTGSISHKVLNQAPCTCVLVK
jgi:nucleotide-binding universal stress UspA family protein